MILFNKWQISVIDDVMVWDGFDFLMVDGDLDLFICIVVFQVYFYFFGLESIEVWQDLGGVDFVYFRMYVILVGIFDG